MTTNREVRFGILGAAAIAPAALVVPARTVAGATVAAVAARDPSRAQAFASRHGIGRVHRSYQDLLDDESIDAVYNPLPNGLHGHWTLRALAAGKHVLCEKPFAANADEAAEVAAAAEASGLVVMEAFHWRYHPLTARLLAIVGSGELGELRHVEGSLCFPLVKTHDIRYDPALAGGALMDVGCYAVNFVRTVVGLEPTVERATLAMTRRGVDRFASAHLSFPGGTTGTVVSSLWSHQLTMHIRVTGSTGELRVFNPMRPKFGGSITVRGADGVRRREKPWPQSTYACQLEAFMAAVLDGMPFPSTAEDAVRNMAVIDAIYRAGGHEPLRPTRVPDGATG